MKKGIDKIQKQYTKQDKQNMMSLKISPPTIKFGIPYGQSASVGTVGSHTICQKSQEESLPHMYWIIGRQTSVSAADPEVACKPAPAPLGCSLQAPEQHRLQQSPTYKRDFVEVQHQ